ncbi:hypothetical protein [Microbacterium sp.]|uniref:hypothetical protein n=1 Tax=Microbacterium sp. TaxID=51671 RepID=UPI003341AC50
MTSQKAQAGKAAPVKHVTTNTGRILRVTDLPDGAPAQAPAVQPAAVVDPARRADVLFRVRRDEGHELSSWWMIGAFVVSSGLVIALLQLVPGTA